MSALDVIRAETRRIVALAATSVRKVIFGRCDADGFSQWTGYQDETFDDVELMQQYGFASRPVGGEALIARENTGESAVAFATVDREYRPDDMDAGEVKLYCTDGNYINLESDGSINIIPTSSGVAKIGSGMYSMVAGEVFNTALAAHLTALGAAFTALNADPLLAGTTKTACATAATAAGAFATAATTWLATKGKVT